MEHYSLIKDLGVVLFTGGLASILCRRVGISSIVGYLLAGMIIGPNTPPISLITGEERIRELSEVGLVFVMFAIGLHLSLSKIAKLGLATIGATALGAFFMLNFTLVLGHFLHWTPLQSMFVAAMLMVSSSAVIAKLMSELNLNHDRAAQMALAITIVEDVVAVIMLTLLASNNPNSGGLGGVLGVLSAFVVLLVGAGLLLMPRVLRKLEAKGDPETLTIIVAGLLLTLCFFTVKAGYSIALGAFLFGAIVAEMRQKHAVETNFAGIRHLFSCVFFVSIGMMINLSDLKEVWLTVLILCTFSLVFRPIACGFALMLVGIPQREARRGGLLLTPLGEFTFIIAAAGIGASILPNSFYPLAVALSVLTVLVTPVLNRFADPILHAADWIEPNWLKKLITAYQSWLAHLGARQPSTRLVRHLRSRLFILFLEILFVSGVLIFAKPVLAAIEKNDLVYLPPETLRPIFWSIIAIILLIPLVTIWRNLSTLSLIVSESLAGTSTRRQRALRRVIEYGLKAAATIGILYWLNALIPTTTLSTYAWLAIVGISFVLILIFFKRLVYWHSSWEDSVQQVLAEDPRLPTEVRAEARIAMDESLNNWQLQLVECVLPDSAACTGQDLTQLAIPSRFGCSIIEVERNSHVITVMRPDLRLYPGDKILILGPAEKLKSACEFLKTQLPSASNASDAFSASVLETITLPASLPENATLENLNITQRTGLRVAGINRNGEQILNPAGTSSLHPGDLLLIVGTIPQLRSLRQYLQSFALPQQQ